MTDRLTCVRDDDVMRFLGGTLDSAARDRIEQHLAVCPRCAHLIGTAAAGDSTPRSGPQWSDLRPTILLPGTVLARRYTVEKLLGAGAMGEVHEATDALSGGRVALKALRATSGEDTKALSRLRSEALLAMRVTHPNVCRVFDLGIDPGRDAAASGLLFLTMECLDGPTLATTIKDGGAMAPGPALLVLKQIAAGLAAAHAVGVVHRDLKASNVMLVGGPSGTQRAVITDFGLADSLGQGGVSWASRSMFYGTPAYAAPEQIAGGRATPRSDVYSFGVLAFELLTGRRPAGCVQCQDDASHAGTAPSAHAPPRLDAEVPAPLRTLITRALQQRPERRFADATALSAALDQVSARLARPLALRGWVAGGITAGVAGAVIAALAARAPADKPRPAPLSAPPATVAVEPAAPASVLAGAAVAASEPPAAAAALTPPAPTASRPLALADGLHRPSRSGHHRLPAAPVPEPVAADVLPAIAAPVPSPPPDELVRELRSPAVRDQHDLVDPFAANRPVRDR